LTLPLPWLSLRDGAFLSLPDGAVHRLPVPGDVLCRLSTGSTLFLVHADGASRSLMSHSSSATTRAVVPGIISVYKKRAHNIRKAIVSDHLSAVLINRKIGICKDIISTRKRQGCNTNCSPLCLALTGKRSIADIAIFQKEVYILTTDQELFVLNDRDRKEMYEWGIGRIPRDDHEDVSVKKKYYLAVSGDQLLMVKRLITLPPTFPRDKPDSRFEVFEARDLEGGRGQWKKVDNLNGRTLFVSEACSESRPIAGSTTGVPEDCIYFVTEGNNTYSGKKIRHESPFLDSGVYDMRKETTTPLPFETVHAAHEGCWSSTWFFPET
jgi:hypothetical protein